MTRRQMAQMLRLLACLTAVTALSQQCFLAPCALEARHESAGTPKAMREVVNKEKVKDNREKTNNEKRKIHQKPELVVCLSIRVCIHLGR